MTGKLEGAPPPVDLADEIKAGRLVRALIREDKVSAVHDVSDGGLLVAVAEMALAGSLGVELFAYEGGCRRTPCGSARTRAATCSPSIRCAPRRSSSARGCWPSRPHRRAHRRRGHSLKGEPALTLADLKAAHEAWLPGYMAAADTTPAAVLDGRAARWQRSCLVGASTAPGRTGTDFWRITHGHGCRRDRAAGRAKFPDAQIEIRDLAGDGGHYAAHVVSSAFKGKTRVQQHQMVYEALGGRMGGALHALALTTAEA